MHRIWFCFAMAISCVGLGVSPTVAQTTALATQESLTQTVEAKNSIAKFSISLTPANASVGQEVTLSIAVAVADGWHIGATTIEPGSIGFPTQIKFQAVGLEPADAEFVPSVAPSQLELASGDQQFMEGEFQWTRKYRVTSTHSSYSGAGTVRFQACDDAKCLPPQTVEFALGQTQPTEPTSKLEKPMQEDAGVSIGATEKTVGAPMVLSLEPSELTRTRPQIGNVISLILFGKSTEEMVWKGTISEGLNQGVSIYLPKARKYSLENTGSDGTIVNNTATFVSVDQNGDGVLDGWEAAAVDQPIRVHDTMYRVTEINPNEKTLTLQQLDIPLKGSLVGFRCPNFEFTALDGTVITNKSILGKTTVLDIWAVTCHNCYEGFPNLQRCLDKHAAENLQVILLTVDTDRSFYDSQAPRLFQKYGGGEWPQVMIPGGFDGALTIGNYGFGSVVVDATGIVRAVGMHGVNIESTIDEVMKQAELNASQPENSASQETPSKEAK